jgi:hypothetical protein
VATQVASLDTWLRREQDLKVLTENKDLANAERILIFLREEKKLGREWVPAKDLNLFSLNYRGRISDLREMGFVIEWNGRRTGSAYRIRNP